MNQLQTFPASKEKSVAPFFEDLFDIILEYGSQQIIEKFIYVKKHQENYLKVHWENTSEHIELNIFREIDYAYLLSLFRSQLSTSGQLLFESHYQIVNLCLQHGEFQKARAALSYLSSIIPEMDLSKQADLLMLKARLAFLANEWETSRVHTLKALPYYKQLNHRIGLLNAYNNLGILAFEQWETAKGKRYFTRAKYLIKSLREDLSNSTAGNLSIESNLGVIEDIQGNSEQALTIFNDILVQFSDAQSHIKVNTLISKGITLRNLHRFPETKQVLEEAKQLAMAHSFHRLLGLIHLALADVEVRNGAFEKAHADAIKAFAIFAKLQDSVSLADTYRVFGMLYREQLQYDLAESQFQLSLMLNKRYDNLLNLSETYYELSRLAKNQLEPRLQREYLQEAIKYSQAMDADQRTKRLQNELTMLA
ncbi:MAG TPA: tetratricopeptide repeat protein [bacterium]|nr:tetratricopeptide repeat protein [bacterium]